MSSCGINLRRPSFAIQALLVCLPLLAVPVDSFGAMFPPGGPIRPPRDPPCEWLAWSPCDASCNGGASYRTRIVTRDCEWGPFQQLRVCNTQPCPQNCVLSEWTEWSCGTGCGGCSAPCGGGFRSRTRTVLSPASSGGTCGDTVQTDACNTHPCPYDCVITSPWSSWKGCSVQCGGGLDSRSRSFELVQVVRTGNSETEASCPSYFEERSCNVVSCPIDCVLAQWSQWTPCPVANSYYNSFRYRQPDIYPQNGGRACDGNLLEHQPCGSYSPPSYNPPSYNPPAYKPLPPPAPQYPQAPQYPSA